MSVDLKKRFDRIVDMLIQLQSKRIIKAQELADRFNVSLRTIYRDIKSLEQAGVPIIGEAGTGYSLVDGYKLPPVVFTKEEALSFIGAEKLMEKFMDQTISADYKSAMYKIKSVLKMSDKDSLSAIESQIIMQQPSYQTFNTKVPHALRTFFESIAQKKQVQIVYKGLSDDQPRQRVIEPIGLYHESNYWYTAAYCLKRSNYRQFRADRIFQIELLDNAFHKEHISLRQFLSESKSTSDTTEIRILVNKEMARYMQWQRQYYGFIEEIEHGDKIELRFECSISLEAFARWYLMYADQSQILQPQGLKEKVKEILTRSLTILK